jgi:DNA helicase-2/ATP-dependent DNA helicase PcrA
MYAQRTRFITRAMLALFDDRLWPPLKPLENAPAPLPESIDLRAQMRGMWAK